MASEKKHAGHRPARALVLLSGGLDSQLAVCILREQGVEVSGLVYSSPFFDSNKGEKAADALQIPVIIEDFTENILALLNHPAHGFGAVMNPCIDCHTAMIRHAGKIMVEHGFDFVATGEVLNQRAMSQNRQALDIIARASGLTDKLLRPLSAQLLPATHPEQAGMVNRARLLKLEGRNRKPQMALAEKYGIRDYPQPAGGCLLTDKMYGHKLRDLRDHEGLANVIGIRRLLIGRHFRTAGVGTTGYRLIIGRDHRENIKLAAGIEPGETVIRPADAPGALGLLAPNADAAAIRLAAAICARYSDHVPGLSVRMTVQPAGGVENILEIMPVAPADVEHWRIQQGGRG